MRTLLIPALLLTSLVTAQTQTFTLPSGVLTTANTNVPLSSGIGRYQQWFAANQITAALGRPMRFESMQFLAGTVATLATSIDCEVAIGLGNGSGMTGAFDSNFAAPKFIVFPRGVLALAAGAAGNPVFTVNIPAPYFTWDGVSPLVIELRIFGNGRGNTNFAYDFRATQQGIGKLSRVYQGGNANATAGVPQDGQGLYTIFRARPGTTISYGNGCPGPNFVTPIATVSQVPEPSRPWTHQVGNASPQRLAMLVMGDSRTQWNGVPLPLDLSSLIGAGGCYLLASPLTNVFTSTIGGPGAGIASVTIQMPPFTSYVGLSFYAQWFIADPSAVNFVMSSSNAIWSIVKALGT